MIKVNTFLGPIVLLIYCVKFRLISGCGYPGNPLHSTIKFEPNPDDFAPYQVNTVVTYSCDEKYDLIGEKRRSCQENGTWFPAEMPFCVINIAKGEKAYQSSIFEQTSAQKAVDGLTSNLTDQSTCTSTDAEDSPWWSVRLSESSTVALVRVDFGLDYGEETSVTVRIGETSKSWQENGVCSEFIGSITSSKSIYFTCSRPLIGSFVSVHLKLANIEPVRLSICEVYVYPVHGKCLASK